MIRVGILVRTNQNAVSQSSQRCSERIVPSPATTWPAWTICAARQEGHWRSLVSGSAGSGHSMRRDSGMAEKVGWVMWPRWSVGSPRHIHRGSGAQVERANPKNRGAGSADSAKASQEKPSGLWSIMVSVRRLEQPALERLDEEPRAVRARVSPASPHSPLPGASPSAPLSRSSAFRRPSIAGTEAPVGEEPEHRRARLAAILRPDQPRTRREESPKATDIGALAVRARALDGSVRERGGVERGTHA